MKIVVAGGGISGLVVAFRLQEAGHEVTCVEPSERPGGVMKTERREEFLCETGPQSILEGSPDTVALLEDLHLEPEIVRASPAARRRFIYLGGRLRPVPSDPFSLMSSDLLSASGKWRLFREPFVKPPAGGFDPDETVLAFGTRRLGAEAAAKLLAPAAIGIFAGDAARLVIRNAFPKLAALEERHGSLLKGVRAVRKEGGGTGKSISFKDGLERLPRTLARRLGDRLVRATVHALRHETSGWSVDLQTAEGGRTLACDRVVLATPPPVTAGLLAPLAPAAAEALRGIPQAPAAIVALGFRRRDIGMDLDAYGFLVPRGEGATLLGCQYESTVFPGRAPDGQVLLRAILGGVFEPGVVDQPDEALRDHVVAELRTIAGLSAKPDFCGVFRARNGIPQYERGHEARVQTVERLGAELPGLHVVGWALRGVGVNDCVRNAAALARRIAAEAGPAVTAS